MFSPSFNGEAYFTLNYYSELFISSHPKLSRIHLAPACFVVFEVLCIEVMVWLV